MLLGQLPDEEDREAHYGNNRQCDDLPRAEPVQILALVQQDLQSSDPQHQQEQPDLIDRQTHRGRFTRAVDDPGRNSRNDAHRHVYIENPRPGNVVRDPTAQQRTYHGGYQSGNGPHTQSGTRFGFGIARQQQGLRQWHHRTRDGALQDTEQNQQFQRRSERTQERRNGEQRDGPDEQLHLAEGSSEPARQRQ